MCCLCRSVTAQQSCSIKCSIRRPRTAVKPFALAGCGCWQQAELSLAASQCLTCLYCPSRHRYIITKGYCSVLKHAETSTSSGGAASTAQPTSTAAAGLAGNSTGPSTPRSRRNTGSQAVSRRATVEMQTQQFALATGAVGASTGLGFNPSRRGTAEVVGAGVLHPAGSSVLSVSGCGAGAVASRRVSATVGPAGQAISQQPGSRRVTAEQVVQQRLAGKCKFSC